MTPRLLATVLLAAPMLVSLGPARLGPAPAAAEAAAIVVAQPWARATPGAGTAGAVYLTLTANGGPDRLVGISTPAAAMAMVHESYVEGGVSKMRMLDSVALQPGKTVAFQPGGLHIMLEGLQAPLRIGGAFPLTLTFEKAPPQTVTVTVLKPGAPGPMPETKDMPGMKMQDMKDMPGMKM